MVLYGLQERSFLGSAFSEFQYRLHEMREKVVVLEAVAVEVSIHRALIAGFP